MLGTVTFGCGLVCNLTYRDLSVDDVQLHELLTNFSSRRQQKQQRCIVPDRQAVARKCHILGNRRCRLAVMIREDARLRAGARNQVVRNAQAAGQSSLCGATVPAVACLYGGGRTHPSAANRRRGASPFELELA